MRLLFVQSGAGVSFDDENNAYVNSNDDALMWKRYGRYCDELRLLLRSDGKVYTKTEALRKFYPFRPDAEIVTVPDIYGLRTILRRIFAGQKAKAIIDEEVRNADRIIVRTPSFPFSRLVLSLCRKYKKRYMIEVIDDAFGLQWYSERLIKKALAPYCEFTARQEIARAPYVVYVSQHALQERYPTSGKSLGCSDVELPDIDPAVLAQRLAQDSATNTITFGTAGGVGKLKGQEYVIRALAELKAQGIANISYHLAGSCSPQFREYLQRLAAYLNVESQVRFFGPIPHSQIFGWYDHLDAYIQASFSEGLSRSVLEAMSRAVPVACSDVGGNPELASSDMLFRPGNVKDICSVMKKLLDPEVRRQQAIYSFNKAGEFQKSRLDPIRDKFYLDFMRS